MGSYASAFCPRHEREARTTLVAMWFFAFCLLVMKALEETFVSSWGRHDDDGGEWLFAYLTPFQLLSLSLACLSTLSETRLHDLEEPRVETCFTFWCISFFTARGLSRQTYSRPSQPTAPETKKPSVGCQPASLHS
ncbi:hypothetical protein NW759_004623 [Fusarium solani]|nr:hypothetical protein NW759_004623 [Fusarium solani]